MRLNHPCTSDEYVLPEGWVVFAAMALLLTSSIALATGMETNGNPKLTEQGASQAVTSTQSGGNLEGKEIRFGAAGCGVLGKRWQHHQHRAPRAAPAACRVAAG